MKGSCTMELDHLSLVSLYVLLSRHETELDESQSTVLERLSGTLYKQLSVSEMEDVEAYYRGLRNASSM